MVCGPLFVARPDALRVRHVDHEPTIVRPILHPITDWEKRTVRHVLIDCPFVTHRPRGAERDFTAIKDGLPEVQRTSPASTRGGPTPHRALPDAAYTDAGLSA